MPEEGKTELGQTLKTRIRQNMSRIKINNARRRQDRTRPNIENQI